MSKFWSIPWKIYCPFPLCSFPKWNHPKTVVRPDDAILACCPKGGRGLVLVNISIFGIIFYISANQFSKPKPWEGFFLGVNYSVHPGLLCSCLCCYIHLLWRFSYKKVFMSKFFIFSPTHTHTHLYFIFYRTRMIIFKMSRNSIYSVLRKNTSSCGLLHNR